jgi:hypothetical protein
MLLVILIYFTIAIYVAYMTVKTTSYGVTVNWSPAPRGGGM